MNGINWGHLNLHSFYFDGFKFSNFLSVFKVDLPAGDTNPQKWPSTILDKIAQCQSSEI